MKKVYYNIEIIGSRDFINRALEALRLIRKKSKSDFNKVNKYLRRIKTARKSKILLKESQFNVAKPTWTSDLEWYASCIIHEVCHYYLHHIKGIPWKKGNMTKHELICIKEQLRFLKKIKAPKRIIDWCANVHKKKHWYRIKQQKW